MYKYIIIALSVALAFSLTGNYIQETRLEQTRYELGQIRVEYQSAANREQQLEMAINECQYIAGRTDEILGESTDTLQGIREQISEIRKSYEAMEDIINSVHSGGGGGRTGNIRAEEMK